MAEEMWDKLFKKIDQLLQRVEKLEQDVRDSSVIALMGLDAAFIAGVRDRPTKARIIKDGFMKMAEDMGMNLNRRDLLNKRLSQLCRKLEKEQT